MQFLLNHLMEASLFLLWFSGGNIFIYRYYFLSPINNKWKWKNYFDGALTILFLLSMGPIIFIRGCYHQQVESSQFRIFDNEREIPIAVLGGYEWMLNWLKPDEEKRYFFPASAVEINGNIHHLSYTAELRLDETDSQAVKKAYQHSRNDFGAAIDASPELNLAVSDCVKLLAMIPIKVEDEPKLAIRGLSVTDMNERCPLAPKFGYKWVSLEINLP